jgi:hypothetical protein
MFRIIGWCAMLGSVLALAYLRFRRTGSALAFMPWLVDNGKRFLQGRRFSGFREWTDRHLIRPNPPRQRWVFLGMMLSFLLLSLSGFLFALLLGRPMFGIFLMGHLGLGAVFAVCLAGVVLIRARIYRLDLPALQGEEPRGASPASRWLFWIFVLSGLMLVTTALLMMLPLFAQSLHFMTVEIHRYSALAAVLAAAAFAVENLDRPGGLD